MVPSMSTPATATVRLVAPTRTVPAAMPPWAVAASVLISTVSEVAVRATPGAVRELYDRRFRAAIHDRW